MEVTTLLDLCRNKGVKIATAESCTGGMVGAWLTDIPGSSDVYDRGFITYSNDAKCAMLGVEDTTLDTYGAVSEEIAGEMATGALAQSNAQLAVSTTGIAGPGGSEHKPEGRVCFGIATGQGCNAETVEFGAMGRSQVREAATKHAIALLGQTVQAMVKD